MFKKGDVVVAKDGFLDAGESLMSTVAVVVEYVPENDYLLLGVLHPEGYALPRTFSMRGEAYRHITNGEMTDWKLDA